MLADTSETDCAVVGVQLSGVEASIALASVRWNVMGSHFVRNCVGVYENIVGVYEIASN